MYIFESVPYLIKKKRKLVIVCNFTKLESSYRLYVKSYNENFYVINLFRNYLQVIV